MRRVLLALAAWLSMGAAAHAERYVMDYRGAVFGLIDLGNVTLDVEVLRDEYIVRATLESGGLIALFEQTRLSASAAGAVAISDGEVFWRSYALDHVYSGKRRRISMRRAPGVLDVSIEPTYRIWGDPPANEQQRYDSRDPLSSLVAMGIHVARHRRCSGDYLTFDGRFHYRLEMRGGTLRPDYDEGGYRGPVLRCRLRYVPVSGFEATDGGRRNIPEGEIWFALIDGAPIAPPVRAYSPLPVGEAGLYLRSMRRLEAVVESDAPVYDARDPAAPILEPAPQSNPD